MRIVMPASVFWGSVLLIGIAGARADDVEISGRVVDEAGRPVVGAAVDYSWRANGPGTDRDGKRLDVSKEENARLFWGHVGEMMPAHHPEEVRSRRDGRFNLKIPQIFYAVMAMDESRQRGGLVVLPKGNSEAPVEIRLGPLVRVKGRFEGPEAGKAPGWTHVYTLLPPDPSRPLHTNRLVGCGSYEGRFEMALPPGRYLLNGYNDRTDAQLVPDKEIVLTGEKKEVDLGVLRLSPSGPSMDQRVERSKAGGAWGDYTKHYGAQPPRWHITDARGVSKDVQLSDFKGRWVLLDLWGFGCRSCLWTGLPKLVKFYEDHAAERHRFTILAICCDYESECKTMADVDRQLVPIVEHVWGGKTLPFPVLLDSSFKTWESYGLQGLGTVLLIDPDGNLVKGDETVLAEKLKGTGTQKARSQPAN
jgi:hypothetical protein